MGHAVRTRIDGRTTGPGPAPGPWIRSAPMDLGIARRRAAVAAASKGLGYEVAAALAREQVQVAICGRDRDRIEAAAASMEGEVVAIVADVGDPDGATRFVRDARARFGGIDILVTNAGGPPPGTAADVSLEQYTRAFELNCLSTIAMCTESVGEMRERGWGRILAVTSSAVRQPNPVLILSNTARAGVTAYLKTLAREVAADGVTVNSLQPGLHATDRLRGLGLDLEVAAATVPAGRLGDPADFGAVAAFVCSEHAGYITGVALHIDGGAYPGLL